MSHIFALQRILSTKPRTTRRLKDLLSSEGSAIIEMGFIVPIMMIFVTGIVSFGLILNNYLVLSHAADVGARYLAINQGNFSNGATTNPCAMAAAQIQATAIAIPRSKISYSITLLPSASGTATTYTSTNGTSGFGSGTNCASGGNGNMGNGGGTVTVTLSYPATPFIYLFNNSTINLTATTTEIIQ